MSRILVTGGAGFIGSHVADALIRRGHDVTVLDDLSGGYEANVPPAATFVRGSIVDSGLVDGLCTENRFDVIYHLAAYAAEGLSHFIKRFNYTSNVIGSVNLINAAVNTGVQTFVFTSSIAVYGGTDRQCSGVDRRRWMAEAIDVPECRNQVFNVGADETYSLNELASHVARAMNVAPEVVHLPARSEVQHAHSSHDKARRGHRPLMECQLGRADAYVDNEDPGLKTSVALLDGSGDWVALQTNLDRLVEDYVPFHGAAIREPVAQR